MCECMMSVIVGMLLIICLLDDTQGLEFLLNNILIPTDGSGRVLITDIKSTDTEALICRTPETAGGRTLWYLDHEDENVTSSDNASHIPGDYFQGWKTRRNMVTSDGYKIKKLIRISDTAVEGRFICGNFQKWESAIALLILYPINSITASIEMTSRGNKTFRVRCTSTGGRVLNMSVTGPDFNSDLSNIQAVGTLKKMGNDIYTATTGSITGGSERQLYYCTASNGVSTLMGCVGLKDIPRPKGVIAEIVMNPLSVRVSWQAVEDADRYTVTFTKAQGRFQEGPCKDNPHTATLSVDVLNASIAVGQAVEGSVTTMLRAYTTYFITVVAESDVLGTSNDGCNHLILTTPQTSTVKAPQRVVLYSAQSYNLTLSVHGVTMCRYLNGLIDNYRVQYSTQPNGPIQTQDKPIQRIDQAIKNVTKITLTGLTPYTIYSIQVALVNVQGDVGPYSTPVPAETEEATPGPVVITVLPSFYKITITWNQPDIPNGNITHYEVYFGLRHFKPSAVKTTTGLDTSFTTPGRLEPGTEMFFTVMAYTRVGGGEPATINMSTFNRPSAVEGVKVTSLNDASVNVSWNAVIIPDFSIDSYTVVYSPVSESDRRQDGEMTAVFPGSVTSGVITDLEPAVIYQFQVFATVTVDGVSAEGEWSEPAYTSSNEKKSTTDSNNIMTWVIIGIVGIAVCTFGLITACVTCIKKRALPKTDVISTGKNTAYGISTNRTRYENTKRILRPSMLAAQK